MTFKYIPRMIIPRDEDEEDSPVFIEPYVSGVAASPTQKMEAYGVLS
jgi:hypothetical protein